MELKEHPDYEGIQYLNHPSFNQAYDLLILMHPFFDKDIEKEYINNIRELICSYDGPILIMDDENEFENTVNFTEKTFPFSARFFTKTQPCDYSPICLSDEKFYEFIKDNSIEKKIKKQSKKTVGLMGGYYENNYSNNMDCGCLGSLDYLLRQNDFHTFLVKECFYSTRNNINTNTPIKKIKL